MGRPNQGRHILAVLSAAFAATLAVGCSNEDCNHSCPINDFTVDVPKDRVSDVAAVTPTGPCEPEPVSGSPPGVYFFTVTGVGVCHLTVTFRSGAPDFVADVKSAPNSGPCCVGQPIAETNEVDIPENGSADAATDN